MSQHPDDRNPNMMEIAKNTVFFVVCIILALFFASLFGII